MTGMALSSDAHTLVYWTQWNPRMTLSIHRASGDGSGEVKLNIPSLYAPNDLALDPARGFLYWVDTGLEEIGRSDLDGANVRHVMTTGVSEPSLLQVEIDLARRELFAVVHSGGQCAIVRVDADLVDGTFADATFIIDLPAWTNTLALDGPGEKLYWVSGNSGEEQILYRANLDGAGLEIFRPLNLLASVSLSIDPRGRRIYWAPWLGDSISSVDLDNAAAQSFAVPNVGGFEGLFVDPYAGMLYWAHGTKVGRSTLDGRNIQDIFDTGSQDARPTSVSVLSAETVPALSPIALTLMTLALFFCAVVFNRRAGLRR